MKAILPGTKTADKLRREIMTECFAYAYALALHDIYGYGAKRTQRITSAVGEIMTGYADMDAAKLRENMLKELRERGIEFEIRR